MERPFVEPSRVRYSDGKTVIHDGFEGLLDRFFICRRSVIRESSVSNISLAIPLISIEAPYWLDPGIEHSRACGTAKRTQPM